MSFHSSSTVTLRGAPRSAVQRSFAGPKLFIAAASFIAVLVADALLIWATAPSVADLATLYVSTT